MNDKDFKKSDEWIFKIYSVRKIQGLFLPKNVQNYVPENHVKHILLLSTLLNNRGK